MLGVTQYLEREAVNALFCFAATLPKGSEFVFSFAPPEDQSGAESGAAFNAFGRRPGTLGEPWKSRFRPSDLVARLTGLGFSDIVHLTPELGRQRYFPEQQEIREPPCWDHLIAAMI